MIKKYILVGSVADPGILPGSGMSFFRISDPKTPVSESLVETFWVKITFLNLFKNTEPGNKKR